MIVGFTAAYRLDPACVLQASQALDRALAHFPWLVRRTVAVGETTIDFWGHGDLAPSVHSLADGSLLVRAGRPEEDPTWNGVADAILRAGDPADFQLPWEGRILLLRVSADGRSWTLWNDWNGSIPVYHAAIGEGRIASTLEPVTVAAGGYSDDDIHTAALVSLLLNGHYVGDWTLFRPMKTVRPDAVAEWDDRGFRSRLLRSVVPSDSRWDRGWDELAAEMYQRMRTPIARALRTSSHWTLPLSGGADSRLIAAVGAEEGISMTAFTYGPATWKETLYAEKVAHALRIPWKRIDLGTDYLERYVPMWGDWFGSALHFHGMYQMPFLEAVRNEPSPIVTGFIGDPHGGAQTAGMVPGDRTLLRRLTDKWYMWSAEELRDAFRFGIDEAVEEIEAELQGDYDAFPGAPYQKIWMMFQRSHVFGFSFYQPMMYDYWKGVSTPFVDRELARFTLSLPRLALEGRRLQVEMFKKHLPSVAGLPVTFLGMPFKLSKGYLMRRGIGEVLPRPLRRGPLREFNPSRNTLEQDSIRDGGKAALWPIYEAGDRLDRWIRLDRVAAAHTAASGGDLQAVNRLEAVQALALRLLGPAR